MAMVWACASLLAAPALEAQTADTAGETSTYVGAQVCAGCHAREAALWRASEHHASMQPAVRATVLGNFEDARVEGIEPAPRFSEHDDGSFWVEARGGGDARTELEVAYTFGVEPLQQYLLTLPRGYYQAFDVAWDTRPAAAGGQRWFALEPGAHSSDDPLHWSRRLHTWNSACADCHSTHLEKNYEAATDRYDTTWSSIDVSCEACHGPGSEHVREPQRRHLALAPVERRWIDADHDGIAERAPRGADRRELETCARCHSRRTELSENFRPGGSLLDAYRPALLDPGLYHADGQILDEVYVYGSFLQSKMYAAGVTCSDCHDPHSARLRASGNALCARCHSPQRFDTTAHHHHEDGSRGAQCINCHMPTRLYMTIDERRDHSFRIPRPDLSLSIGTPNACTQCHTDRNDRWAAERVAAWYPQGRSTSPHYGQALAAARDWAADRSPRLRALALDAEAPAIARATAFELMGAQLDGEMLPVIAQGLADHEPLVVLGALDALGAAPPELRRALVPPLLDHPRLAVRIQAARLLAPIANTLGRNERPQLDTALEEYRATQRLDADRAEGNDNLGRLAVELGRYDVAAAAFRTALAREPAFVQGYLDWAELLRRQGKPADADRTLEQAATVAPESAAVLLAQGLARTRQGAPERGLALFERAAQLADGDPQYRYVLGVALYSTGERARALEVLAAAHERFPGHRATLLALATMHRDQGDTRQALAYARALLALSPSDTEARALLDQLAPDAP